jgi:hypothetical protein
MIGRRASVFEWDAGGEPLQAVTDRPEIRRRAANDQSTHAGGHATVQLHKEGRFSCVCTTEH